MNFITQLPSTVPHLASSLVSLVCSYLNGGMYTGYSQHFHKRDYKTIGLYTWSHKMHRASQVNHSPNFICDTSSTHAT